MTNIQEKNDLLEVSQNRNLKSEIEILGCPKKGRTASCLPHYVHFKYFRHLRFLYGLPPSREGQTLSELIENSHLFNTENIKHLLIKS
jgi:hypothetical protein